MSMPDVLKDPATEPEAAHLRNVLRRVRDIFDSDLIGDDERGRQVREVIAEALARPTTNGNVVDELVRENGTLRSTILRLEERVRSVQRDAIATHERLRAEIDELKVQS